MAAKKKQTKPDLPPDGVVVVIPRDMEDSLHEVAESLSSLGMWKKGSPAAELERLAVMIDEQGSMQGELRTWETCGVCWGSGVTEESQHNIEQAVLDLREFDLEPDEQQVIDRVLKMLERMLSDAESHARNRRRNRFY